MADNGGGGGLIAVAVIALVAYQCTHRDKPGVVASPLPYVASAPVDQDEAVERAVEDLSGSTYTGQVGSVGCTVDCSGHDAGYEWAQEHDVTDESECGGSSSSFIEGCEAYAQEVQSRAEEIADEGEEE